MIKYYIKHIEIKKKKKSINRLETILLDKTQKKMKLDFY